MTTDSTNVSQTATNYFAVENSISSSKRISDFFFFKVKYSEGYDSNKHNFPAGPPRLARRELACF